MNIIEKPYQDPGLKIETVKGPEESEVSFCPERGGIITSIKLKGKEILYLEPDNLADTTKNVRGGIPILFPNAGPLKVGDYKLAQHGYARTSSEWQVEPTEGSAFSERLSVNEEMKQAFPYELLLRIKGQLEDDGSFSLTQEVENKDEKELPISMGLHPYFKVPNDKKKEIEFDFLGGEQVKKDFATWSSGGTTMIDNPKIKDPNAVLRIKLPDLGTVILDVSAEYKRIWVWSLPDKDFICVEPVMRDVDGLVNDPEIIEPSQTYSGKVNFKLE